MGQDIQYDWKYRLYHNRGLISKSFDKVVKGKVGVRIKKSMWQPHTSLETPFTGVQLVKYSPPQNLTNFLTTVNGERTSLGGMWGAIKNTIFENWMPDKIHVIGASSGFDSRLIAKAIQQLTIQHGSDWLGETYFVECGGEGSGFKQVMKKLGLKNNIVWTPKYDFEYFKDFHKRFNGLCAFPVNQWYDLFTKTWNEEDIQYISGYGGNVSDAMNSYTAYMKPVKRRMNVKQRLIHYFKYQYFYQISAFKTPKYSLHPFWTWKYIRASSGFKHKQNRTAEYLAWELVRECRGIKRMTLLVDVKKLGFRKVPDKVVNQLYEWYRSTDYGRANPIRPTGALVYSRWWLQFCIASYLENYEKN